MTMLPFFAGPERPTPTILIPPGPDFAENPGLVRWRAWWFKDGETVGGIELRAYPVVKLTPAGAWIDPDAYHDGSWQFSGNRRWVSDDGGQAWAKPTQKAALLSIAVRYQRWASRLARDIDYFLAAGETLKVLMPDWAERSDEFARMIAATAERGAR